MLGPGESTMPNATSAKASRVEAWGMAGSLALKSALRGGFYRGERRAPGVSNLPEPLTEFGAYLVGFQSQIVQHAIVQPRQGPPLPRPLDHLVQVGTHLPPKP